MATSFSDIYIRFTDNFSEADAKKINIMDRKKYLRKALTIFSTAVKTITVDFDNTEIVEDLNELQLTLVGLYMYQEYLEQEIYKYNKNGVNISSDLFKITGSQERVKNLKEIADNNKAKISSLLANLLF